MADEKGSYAAKILADMGADVIKIEPPSGDSSRFIAPFFHDIPDPEMSLYFFANNVGKRGVTLNLETTDGKEIFRKLARKADFIVESFPPGHMDSIGLGYTTLSKANPRLILVSITPFGQTGPYRDYKASDITIQAMAGIMSITGQPDHPPVRLGELQSYFVAGLWAALSALAAHLYREETGEGQHIDLSIRESILCCLYMGSPLWQYAKHHETRMGHLILRGKAYQPEVWPCQDGYFAWRIMGGIYGAKDWQAWTEWANSKGMGEALNEISNWAECDLSQITQEQYNRWGQAISDLARLYTREEFTKEATSRGIRAGGLAKVSEVIDNPQLKARDFWQEVEHPELNTSIRYPRSLFMCSRAQPFPRRRAPLIGEHNQEIYQQELGLSSEQLSQLKQARII